MKTSMSTIVFLVVVLSISAICLATKTPVEACIRRNIAQSLSPSPSDEPTTAYLEVANELCRDETRIIMYFLKLNGKFPRYYVKAMCNVFGKDETKVKEYVTTKWLNHSEKLLNSLTCIRRNTLVIKKSPLERCIRRNIVKLLSPPSPPSRKPKVGHLTVIGSMGVLQDDFCRDETREIMYSLKLDGKFPAYYVEALCNVFEDDEEKVKDYVSKKWLNRSEKFINSLSCASL